MDPPWHPQVALGQGQAPVAQKLIDEGEKVGSWVFLANCHLMTSWLPTLAKVIDRTANKRTHEMYRLWLSSNPTPAFPLAILQVMPPFATGLRIVQRDSCGE